MVVYGQRGGLRPARFIIIIIIIIIIIMSAFVKCKINGPQMRYIVALA